MTQQILLNEGAFTADIKKKINDNFTELYGSGGFALGILATVVGINAKNTGGTISYTVPAGKTAIVTGCVIRCTAATAITVGPACGLGTSAGTDDIFASAAINALTTTSKIFGFVLVGLSVNIPALGNIVFNVDTAATGTSQTLAADIMGYLI